MENRSLEVVKAGSARAVARSRPRSRLTPLVLLLAAAAMPAMAQNINTTSSWNGTNSIDPWGTNAGVTPTYGQTITAGPGQTSLSGFSFNLAQESGTAPNYQAFVYQFNPTTRLIVGPALYTSGVLAAPSGAAFSSITVNTGPIALVSGQQYVLFFSTTNQVGQPASSYKWGQLTNTTTYAGGQFVFSNGVTFASLSTAPWTTSQPNDLAFQAFLSGLGSSAFTFTAATAATGNRSAMGAAPVLDSLLLSGTPTGDLANVLAAFNNLNSIDQLSAAASQTVPLMSAGMNQITLNALHDVNRVVQARVDGDTGISAGDGSQSRDFWLKPYGSWATQGARDSVAGYNSRSSGLVGGVDRQFGATNRMGLGVALGEIRVNSSGTAANTATINTYQLIGYGRHSFDDRTDLLWQADAGSTADSGRRTIDFGGLNRVATSDYNAFVAHAGAALTRVFPMGQGTIFAPSLRADYGYIRSQSYIESNAGALSLAVGSNTAQEFIIGADTRIAHKFDSRNSISANIGVGYDALAKTASVNSAFVGGGPVFTTEGIHPSPWLVRGGVALNFAPFVRATPVMLSARYDIEARSNFVNQTASLNIRVPF